LYSVTEANIDELNVEEWENLLLKSKVCDAFQTYEWAQVLRSSFGVHPYFLTVRSNGDPVGGVMYLKKEILGVLDCYEVRGGPLFINGNKLQVMKSIIRTLERKRRKSAYTLFMPYPIINCSLREVFEIAGYHHIPFRTLIIDLDKPLDHIWKALDKDARRGVRKAQRLGVKASIACTKQEWKDYYNLHVLHSREKHYTPEPYVFYEEMFKLHRKNRCRLFVAKLKNRIIAGVLCLIYRKHLVGIRSASQIAFLKYQPNNLVHWKSIEWAKEHGVTIYDWDGLPLEETRYLRGVYEYKKRWDGRVQWYYYYLNNKFLCSGIHLVRTSFFAWKVFSRLRSRRIIPK
jgi:hypothetical protein